MSAFISEISSVLSISLSIGPYNISLGGIALAWIITKSGMRFYHNLAGDDLSADDRYIQKKYGMTKEESSEYHRFMGE